MDPSQPEKPSDTTTDAASLNQAASAMLQAEGETTGA